MTNHVMIDIETLGREPGCAILSIGAIAFNPLTGKEGDSFYTEINTESCCKHSLLIDINTQAWWDQQGDSAKALLERCQTEETDITTALKLLKRWLLTQTSDKKRLKIWANSPSFDLDIIACAYEMALDINKPWAFYNELDCRTAVEIGRTFGIDPKKEIKFEGIQHHALDDAKHQARYVSAIFRHAMTAFSNN